MPLIDSSRLPEKEEETTGLEPQDRVLLFTRPDCDACDAMLARLLGRIDQIAGIDIYLADIDGLMQVNWRWHRDKLGDPWQALDPEHNLQVGARILATCYQERRDRWDAVGCYHAPNNRKFASRYHRNVAAHWRRITQRG